MEKYGIINIVNYNCNYGMWLHMKMNFDLVIGVMGILCGIITYIIDSDHIGIPIMLIITGLVFIFTRKKEREN